jgi:F-type H+-transporting ATPase subunit c
MELEAIKVISAALCMCIGGIIPTWAEGTVAAKGIEGMARNPEAIDKLFPNMVVAMAICESVAIYCLVTSLIILFVI